jgi:hypothetical protein
LLGSRQRCRGVAVILLVALFEGVSAAFEQPQTGSISQKVEHVIHIVVDGLRPSHMPGKPNFDWLRANGVCTTNARHDPVTSQTLPNHIDSEYCGIVAVTACCVLDG